MTALEGGARGDVRPAPPDPPAPAAPRRASRAQLVDRVSRVLLWLSGGFSVVVVVLVIAFLLGNALPLFTTYHVDAVGFFSSTTWQPDAGGFGSVGSPHFGAVTPIIGSLTVVGLALVIAVPFALAVAVFLEETNPQIGDRLMRPAIEVFVGIPSVVYGFLGLVILIPIFQRLGPPGSTGGGIFPAAVVLAIMIIPTIAALSADGLRAVPVSLKEGSLALGATEWQTIRRVLLPAARRSIISGIVLGLARAMGEALAVALLIGDANIIPDFAKNGARALFQATTTMTVTITDGVVESTPQAIAARYMLAVVLLVITFLSIIVVRLVNRSAVVAV